MKFILLLTFITNILFSIEFNSNIYTLLKEFDIDKSFLQDTRVQTYRNKLKGYKLSLYKEKIKTSIYASMVKKIIQKDTIPDIFFYLAMVESNFNITELSSAKAAGIWQFMPLTAKIFNLDINKHIDQRKDHIKSTYSAIKFLKAMHKRFDKWYLAAMAYNCGEGRLIRAIKAAQSESLVDLMNEEKAYIPRETRNYIVKIIALASVINVDKYLMQNPYYLQYIDIWLKRIYIKNYLDLRDVSKVLDLDLEKFFEFNPHLNNKKMMPPYKTYIYVPKHKVTLESRINQLKIRSHIKFYEVMPGNTLYGISLKFDTTVRTIKSLNDMSSSKLKIGQVLRVRKDKYLIYIVQNGDNLYNIAKKYNTTVNELKKINNIKNSMIKPNQKLKVKNV